MLLALPISLRAARIPPPFIVGLRCHFLRLHETRRMGFAHAYLSRTSIPHAGASASSVYIDGGKLNPAANVDVTSAARIVKR